jgi:hypothetical protein
MENNTKEFADKIVKEALKLSSYQRLTEYNQQVYELAKSYIQLLPALESANTEIERLKQELAMLKEPGDAK